MHSTLSGSLLHLVVGSTPQRTTTSTVSLHLLVSSPFCTVSTDNLKQTPSTQERLTLLIPSQNGTQLQRQRTSFSRRPSKFYNCLFIYDFIYSSIHIHFQVRIHFFELLKTIVCFNIVKNATQFRINKVIQNNSIDFLFADNRFGFKVTLHIVFTDL